MAKAKEAVQTVENDIKEIIKKVKVELKEIKEGIHTIFLKGKSVEFKDGTAEVEKDVADELKTADMIK